jgi:hypothetical protein
VIAWLPGRDVPTRLRTGVLALAALGIAGTTLELVFLRHWTSLTQLVVWPGILALLGAFTMLVGRPTSSRVTGARAIAGAVLIVAAIGVALHVYGNLEAGPLDRDYATTWATMSSVEQWWLAITGGVGPAPVLAPGVLAEISLALLLATVAHPVFAAATTPTSPFPGDRGVQRLD